MLCQVHLTAKDGTEFVLANAHIVDGSRKDDAANINARIPGSGPEGKDRFKIQATRNMLTSLVAPAASQEEAVSGKPPPVVVLAGDFNSEQAQVESAIEGAMMQGDRCYDAGAQDQGERSSPLCSHIGYQSFRIEGCQCDVSARPTCRLGGKLGEKRNVLSIHVQ